MAAKRRKKAKRHHRASARRKHRANPRRTTRKSARRTHRRAPARRRASRRKGAPRVLVVASNPRRRRHGRRISRRRKNPGMGLLVDGLIAIGTGAVGLGLATVAAPHLPDSIQADQRKGGAVLLGAGVLGGALIEWLTGIHSAALGFGAGVGAFGAYELAGGIVSSLKAKKDDAKPAPSLPQGGAPTPQLPPSATLPVIAPTSAGDPVEWLVEDYDPSAELGAGPPDESGEAAQFYAGNFESDPDADYSNFWAEQAAQSGEETADLSSALDDVTISRVSRDPYIRRVSRDPYIRRVSRDPYIRRVSLNPFD